MKAGRSEAEKWRDDGWKRVYWIRGLNGLFLPVSDSLFSFGTSMRRKLSLIAMLTAWLLATGSHWDLVQTFAWGRMIATYSQTMPLAQAIKLTFTPDNLCGVCKSVSEAKQQQDTALPSEAKTAGKILMVYQAQPVFVAKLSTSVRWMDRERNPQMRDRSPPPVPPPRALV
jgi:hypothetical protein